MSKFRIFIVSLVLLTLLVTLVSGCNNETDTPNNSTKETTGKYTLAVEVNPSGGGTTSPAVGTHDYDDGTEVDVTATASDGYVFDHWSGAASGNTTSASITINSNQSITAHFSPVYDLAVNVESVGAGEVTLSEQGPYNEDEEVTLTATPADGYVFDHWSGAASGTTSPVTITMDSNQSITAHFAPTYDLTVSVEPVGAGEVTLSEEGPYKEGTEVTLTAIPANGYEFDHWSGAASGTTSPVTITMDSNKNVTAHFTPIVICTLTVVVVPDYGGTVQIIQPGPYEPDTEVTLTVEAGTEVTLTVSLNSVAFKFDGWYLGDSSIGTSKEITIIMDSDKDITARINCGY